MKIDTNIFKSQESRVKTTSSLSLDIDRVESDTLAIDAQLPLLAVCSWDSSLPAPFAGNPSEMRWTKLLRLLASGCVHPSTSSMMCDKLQTKASINQVDIL